MKNKAKIPALITILIAVFVILIFNFIKLYYTNETPDKFKDCDVLVHFIDVGQGDSVFAQLPNGETMLIDAGENGYDVVDYISSYGEDTLDYVIATHPHSDHIGGMTDVINTFEVKKFFMPDASNNTASFENMLDALIFRDVNAQYIKAGDVICNKDGLKIEVLSPGKNGFDDLNDMSAVVKLTYKNKSFLFTGDAEKNAEKQIKGNVKADVLKVGHHGSDTSTGKAFLDKVDPDVAVISVGEDNDYNHPDNRVIKRLESKNITIFRTDISGDILIGTDGEKIIY